MTDAGSSPRRTAVVEARARAFLDQQLRRRGWTPAVVPHVAYGGDGWVRALARVVLVPPGSPRSPREDGRGWRRFITTPAEGIPVTVRVGNHVHHLASERQGYVDVRLASDLEPGWREATYSVEGADPVEGAVHVVGPTARVGVVSDVDDTVIETMVPRPLLAFRNAFLTRESDRLPVSGMAELFTEITEAHPDVFVVYLSTGAWNTAVPMQAFLTRHRYPPGPLLLTDWGPTGEAWFRSGREHKRAQLATLFADLPALRWLLVGDDGQHDPELYAAAATAAPDRVLGVAIRQVSLAQHMVQGRVSAPDTAAPSTGDRSLSPVTARNGFGLRDGLRSRGILLGPRAD